MPHNHLNQLGIFRENRLKYYLPILPERVGIVLGQHHRNRKKIADMFKCTISFLSNNIYNYPICIIQSDDEINIWYDINYIQYIVTIQIKRIILLQILYVLIILKIAIHLSTVDTVKKSMVNYRSIHHYIYMFYNYC